MNHLDNQENKVATYRVVASLFMTIPDIEIIKDFEIISNISIHDTYEEICDDYIELFIEGKVPNCEGYYRDIIYENAPFHIDLNDVQRFYWSAGVAMDEEFDLSPDHISMELFFMSHLIEQNLRDLQIEFLRRLYKWVPLFCDNLYEKANTDFYKEVATFLKEFILAEIGVI